MCVYIPCSRIDGYGAVAGGMGRGSAVDKRRVAMIVSIGARALDSIHQDQS
jgi:hypothetical protein